MICSCGHDLADHEVFTEAFGIPLTPPVIACMAKKCRCRFDAD